MHEQHSEWQGTALMHMHWQAVMGTGTGRRTGTDADTQAEGQRQADSVH